jgi:hypothetical protein
MSSCLRGRKSRRGADTQPLLPREELYTQPQRYLHQKMHTHQMFRALSQGYMPSTEQAIANLRVLLASDLFNPPRADLSDSGRQLVRDCRLCLQIIIDLLREKNEQDQLQDLIWHLSRSRASLDTSELANQASQAKARADSKAAYDNLRTVWDLLLTNSDFRLLVDDLATIGRQIFADTAFSLSETAQEVGKKTQPSPEERDNVNGGAGADEGQPPSVEEIQQEATAVVDAAGNGVVQVGRQTLKSVEENLSGGQREALLDRLKQTVLKLRKQNEYLDWVSTFSLLVKRYGTIYSRAVDDIVSTVNEDVNANTDLHQAVRSFWALARSFGDREEWESLEERFHQVMRHANKDPEFESLMPEIGSWLQNILTDPDFLDAAGQQLTELKEKVRNVGSGSSLRQDVDAFLQQWQQTLHTVLDDPIVAKLITCKNKILNDVWSAYNNKTSSLVADLAHIFLPLLIRAVQHIPIPRLEISVPEMDLLVESLILEPGRTVNQSSFLPYKIKVSSRTDMELSKVHSKRATSNMKTLVTVSVLGLNVSASDFGYWIRTHSGPLFRFKDEGIASFYLDERGVDISVDLEIGRGGTSQMITLRGVRAHIHKLEYKVLRSKWKFLLWLVKPFLKQLIRRVLEKKIAEEILVAVSTLNRELAFARERLRAATIAAPHDLGAIIRAVLARSSSGPHPDVYKRLGIRHPDTGLFQGIYAPGSIIKLWEDEAERAHEAIGHGDESDGLGVTWRNEIFDVSTRSL